MPQPINRHAPGSKGVGLDCEGREKSQYRATGPAPIPALEVLQALRSQPPHEQGELACQKHSRRHIPAHQPGGRQIQKPGQTRTQACGVRLSGKTSGQDPHGQPESQQGQTGVLPEPRGNCFSQREVRGTPLLRGGLGGLYSPRHGSDDRLRRGLVGFCREAPPPPLVERTRASKLCRHCCRFVPSKPVAECVASERSARVQLPDFRKRTGLMETFVIVGARQNNRTDRSLHGTQSRSLEMRCHFDSIHFLPIWLKLVVLPHWHISDAARSTQIAN